MNYSKDEILEVLREVRRKSPTFRTDEGEPRYHRWLLTYLFSSVPYWLEHESEVSVFNQLIRTMRALSLGVEPKDMDEHLFVALSLHNHIRGAIQQVEKVVYLDGFTFPGIGQHLLMRDFVHAEVKKKFEDEGLDIYRDIFRGGNYVSSQTLHNLADAFDEFVKELSQWSTPI